MDTRKLLNKLETERLEEQLDYAHSIEKKDDRIITVSDDERVALTEFGVDTQDYIDWKKEAFQYIDKQESLIGQLRQALREIMDPFQTLKTQVTRDVLAMYLSKEIYKNSNEVETLLNNEQENIANFQNKIETLLVIQYNRYISAIAEQKKQPPTSLKQIVANWWYSPGISEPIQKPSADKIATFQEKTMAECARNACKLQAQCEKNLREIKAYILTFHLNAPAAKNLATDEKSSNSTLPSTEPVNYTPQHQLRR